MKYVLILLLSFSIFVSCKEQEQKESSAQKETSQKAKRKQETKKEDNSLPALLTQNGFQLFNGQVEPPEIKAVDLKGKQVQLSDFKGKVIILNFWATWCPPCVHEMPSMNKLYNKFKDSKFEMLALSVEDNKTIKNFMKNNDYHFNILAGDSQTATEYGVSAIPASYIIGKDGKLLAGIVGGIDWYSKSMIKLIETLVSM